MLTLQTDIWLVVRVPVLSEQMTEVQPSVSTDGSERTMAFLRAIRRVPSAKQVVITAGRPGRGNSETDAQLSKGQAQRTTTRMSWDARDRRFWDEEDCLL